MLNAVAGVVAGYAIGSVPVAWAAGKIAGGIDIRTTGSGNPGASNIWQSVSRWLTVPVGLAQIAQGLLAVLAARALDVGAGGAAAAGVAAVVANNWSPWLRFSGGRGIGASIGVLLAISWPGLGAFIALALAGVALRAVPQGVGLGLIAAPVAAAVAGDAAATVAGCAALAAVALAKRVLANGPLSRAALAAVWRSRLVYDRDVPNREAWVHRGARPSGGAGARRDG